jgi:hypothetical protein
MSISLFFLDALLSSINASAYKNTPLKTAPHDIQIPSKDGLREPSLRSASA